MTTGMLHNWEKWFCKNNFSNHVTPRRPAPALFPRTPGHRDARASRLYAPRDAPQEHQGTSRAIDATTGPGTASQPIGTHPSLPPLHTRPGQDSNATHRTASLTASHTAPMTLKRRPRCARPPFFFFFFHLSLERRFPFLAPIHRTPHATSLPRACCHQDPGGRAARRAA